MYVHSEKPDFTVLLAAMPLTRVYNIVSLGEGGGGSLGHTYVCVALD